MTSASISERAARFRPDVPQCPCGKTATMRCVGVGKVCDDHAKGHRGVPLSDD